MYLCHLCLTEEQFLCDVRRIVEQNDRKTSSARGILPRAARATERSWRSASVHKRSRPAFNLHSFLLLLRWLKLLRQETGGRDAFHINKHTHTLARSHTLTLSHAHTLIHTHKNTCSLTHTHCAARITMNLTQPVKSSRICVVHKEAYFQDD